MVGLALGLGVVFLGQAGRSVRVHDNVYCPRNVLQEMFNLNEHIYHEGEYRPEAQIDAEKATCRRAAATSMILGYGSLAGALALFLGAAAILARPSRRAQRTVLTTLGVALVFAIVIGIAR